MTNTTLTLTEEKKIAYANYVVENDALMLNYRPIEFLTQKLYADANDYTAYLDYLEFMTDGQGVIQEELEIHFNNALFIEAMEADEKFEFVWNVENDLAVALNDVLQIAYKENDFWVFEEIAHKVFTDDEGTNAEEAMKTIKEMDEEGNGFAFASLVYNYINDKDANFIKAAANRLVYFANDIFDWA